MPRTRPRPLIARPGARFACFGDGLCCTDIHALGPITRSEARDMRAISPAGVFHNPDIKEPCLKPGAGGGCHFLDQGRCGVHARLGPEAKPVGCRRFPYGLVATPSGGRVSTEHRCPCRTLGTRPALDLADAEASLRGRNGRLEVDQRIPDRIPWTRGKRIPFAAYEAIEARLLERLAAGERAETVLDADPLPPLHSSSWPALAAEFFDMHDDTAGGEALVWFGDCLLYLASGHTPPGRRRPWQASFERAMTRVGVPMDPEAMVNDWVADELWMFRWFEWDEPFDVARAELVTRLTVVREAQRRIEAMGVRPDQATAEAITIGDVATASTEWPAAVDCIANDPSPARALG